MRSSEHSDGVDPVHARLFTSPLQAERAPRADARVAAQHLLHEPSDAGAPGADHAGRDLSMLILVRVDGVGATSNPRLRLFPASPSRGLRPGNPPGCALRQSSGSPTPRESIAPARCRRGAGASTRRRTAESSSPPHLLIAGGRESF